MVRELVVVSGKGGTGKTSIAASLASLASEDFKLSLADCDVEASNLPILLNPEVRGEEKFSGSKLASIDLERCTRCMRCEEECRFDAIRELRVDELACEGCGVCVYVCPAGAVELRDRDSGLLYLSETRYGPLAHARLNPGESNSGKLVALVRHRARQAALERGASLILSDGPPGVGCPAISSITGVDFALVVAEPTLSGLHDLKRILELLSHFRAVKPLIAVNMWDINPEISEEIKAFCMGEGLDLVGMIPFDKMVAEAAAQRKPVVEYAPNGRASLELKKLWREVKTVTGLGG
ncbi:MAG: (4Fe-4S)-binding protein [Candidatus Hecatellales archaeon]|nr:MAG: (4Fe-4S)-binding protein [Candidatus Hecatellales archaeon]